MPPAHGLSILPQAIAAATVLVVWPPVVAEVLTGGDVETVTVDFTCSLVEITGGHIGTFTTGVEGGLITSPAVIDVFNDETCRTTYAFDTTTMGEYNWLPANCADLSLTVEQISPDRVRVTVSNEGPSTATDVRASITIDATPAIALYPLDFQVAFGGLNRASLEPGASVRPAPRDDGSCPARTPDA